MPKKVKITLFSLISYIVATSAIADLAYYELKVKMANKYFYLRLYQNSQTSAVWQAYDKDGQYIGSLASVGSISTNGAVTMTTLSGSQFEADVTSYAYPASGIEHRSIQLGLHYIKIQQLTSKSR